MENLLEKLSKQAMVEAREALRQLVSTLNGLAGIHILDKKVCCVVRVWSLLCDCHMISQPHDAMCCYYEAMGVWQEYKEEMAVDCDKLQRIHALENLASLLRESPQDVPAKLLPGDGSEPEALLTVKSQQLMDEV